ncbi:hypothetical protein HK105_204329 [Polyrhizophydium stewartii]|uniref:Methyltransferase FkbM domain-containing protein n=1 Tax=Polyrhizophydium stewartii TaxID=2732419 RepID=A0ABR4N9P4_9FUNG|nr:hypothetical protein HK105_007286 [Polyrhizophydium stewartii]
MESIKTTYSRLPGVLQATSRRYTWLPYAVLGLLALLVVSVVVMVGHSDKSLLKLSANSRAVIAPPRYVFVDLGANSGDSCLMFLQDPEAPEKFEFPTPEGKTHADAEIYLFEANPTFNTDLVDLKQKLKNRGININIYPSTPVWTESKLMTFHIDLRDRHAAGSSLNQNHPDLVRTGSRPVNLTSVAISQWLLERFLPEDFVIVKMDIETTEYNIVPHLAAMQAGKVIDLMFVEWHSWLMNGSDPLVGQSAEAVKLLEAQGVKFPSYSTSSRKRKRTN